MEEVGGRYKRREDNGRGGRTMEEEGGQWKRREDDGRGGSTMEEDRPKLLGCLNWLDNTIHSKAQPPAAASAVAQLFHRLGQRRCEQPFLGGVQ